MSNNMEKPKSPHQADQLNLDFTLPKSREEIIQSIRGKIFGQEGGELTPEEQDFKDKNSELFDSSDDQYRFGR